MPGYELIDKKELKEINKIFKNGSVFFRHGFEKLRKNSYKVKDFENKFKKLFKSNYALAVTSGTAALRVALSTLNLKKTDEVITQCFTFVATVEAIVESGAVPVCTEIDKTLNMDPNDLIKKINNKTKAVIVVHMLGVPAEMTKIRKICKKKKLVLIEDTAWGCGGKYNNKFLGTIGRMGTFSFDHAKSITTGEGGMILFQKKRDYELAKAWHDHGHENNPKVPRWEDTRKSSGFNFRMTELQGAIGLVQIEKLNKLIKKQRSNSFKILKQLKNIPNLNITVRATPKNSYSTFDSLILHVKNSKFAKKSREILISHEIGTKILPEATLWHFAKNWSHIKNLNKKHKNNLKKSFPKSSEILDRSISIPINYNMNKKFFKNIKMAFEKIANL